jgi:hypothetical protein
MLVNTICTPALIYLIFSVAHVLIDTFKGLYNTALIKIFLTIFFTFILNHLCQLGLGILSWLIIFVPFILMTVIVTMLLFTFNLDPKTGKIRKEGGSKEINRDIVLYHDHGENYNGGENGGEGDNIIEGENLKHGIGIRGRHKSAASLEDKRNYRFKLDSEYTAGPEMRHVRDQRLLNY